MIYKYNCNKKYNYFGESQEKKGLSKDSIDTIASAEATQALSFNYFSYRYR